MPNSLTVTCPYCKQPAEWISNEAVYGRRYGDSYMCYWCRECDAMVGCHQNSRKPLGTLAKKELRELRVAAHAHIDPLWRSGRFKRSTVYKGLEHVFGREIHIGEADAETCRQILALRF